MRARMLCIVALLASLVGCGPMEPRTPDDMHAGVYPTVQPAEAQQQPQQQPQQQVEGQDQKPEPLWPRRFARGETAFATYEPQIDAWENDQIKARVAVEVHPSGAKTPTYGIAWFEARTVTDRARNEVTFEDVRVVRVHFPTAKEREAEYLEVLRGADVVEAKTTSIDRLKHQAAYAASLKPLPAEAVKNYPPAIVVRPSPTVLVLVDGPPQLRDEEGGIKRVINTRALVLADRSGSTYVWAGDRWHRSSAVDGTYAPAQGVPPEIDAAKKRVEGSPTVELFSDAADRIRQGASVLVATKPTELIETRGAPAYEAIPGTAASWVSNTESDVLRDETTKQTYVLLSGRWFRAPSLDGPWTYVPGKDVPASFRSIPKDHREARVLASIPGTPQAEEAVIAASVPQTATVDRSQVRLGVSYDGPPNFQPVQGTSAPLRYAVNTATPVIQSADGMYYAVENGVWFVSAAPDGPWTVATSVPGSIYSIPPSSPIHNVTYVRIYGYSPQYAHVGYTPGYMGALYTDGVVVWGTGYGYRPWVGNVWYGWPSTYGFGVGFGFRPPVVVVGRPYPWWGPTRFWRPGWGWYGPYGYGVARAPVYQHWAPSVVRAPPAYPSVAPRAYAPAAPRVGAPGAPRVYVPAAPRVGAPASPNVAPRVYAPNTPRYSAPSVAPSPRVYAPSTPRYSAPPVSAPRYSAPPVSAPRYSAPPAAAPRFSAPAAPRVSAPPARRR